MDTAQLKKIIGNYTQFTEDVKEYQYGFGKGNKRGSGNILCAGNGADCSKAKWLELYDPKTEDLSWISDVFPNIEVLELAENKPQKLKSLDGIEGLKNLKSIIVNSQFDENCQLEIKNLSPTINELYLWYTKLDFNILNNQMNFIYLHENQVTNFDKIKSINCNYLKLHDIKDDRGSKIGVENFQGEFKDFSI
jgi:hypothetical protein